MVRCQRTKPGNLSNYLSIQMSRNVCFRWPRSSSLDSPAQSISPQRETTSLARNDSVHVSHISSSLSRHRSREPLTTVDKKKKTVTVVNTSNRLSSSPSVDGRVRSPEILLTVAHSLVAECRRAPLRSTRRVRFRRDRDNGESYRGPNVAAD